MHKLGILFVCFFSISVMKSQELNSLVTVNYSQIQGSNTQVFKTLEKSLTEFINQTKWTNKDIKPEERIDCAFTIIITSRDDNTFKGTIQIQSSRPVYDSSYTSPILNLKDNDFNFKYNEFDPLIYNKNSFDSNLLSTLVFYVNVVLGADADTFKNNGGLPFYKEAQNVMLQAQQSGLAAWSNQVGVQNRFQLIDNLLSPNLKQFRNAMYDYHRKGFDEMAENKLKGKGAIENAIISLDRLYNKVIGNPLLRTFFDAKSDEIINLYSDGPNTRSKQRLIVVLQKISPNNSSKWRKIN